MKFGLLGENISYSLSPLIFKTISKYMNIELSYELFDVEEPLIENIITKLKNGELHGLNVTKPYKEIVIQYCDVLSQEANEIQSVNTLVMENGQIKGYNTDIYGFEKLYATTGFNNIEPIFIFGNGGSSKAVMHVLNQKDLKFVVVKRNNSKRKRIHNDEIAYEELKQGSGLIIQTTTVGLNKEDKALVEEKTLQDKSLIDLIYHMPETIHMKLSKHKYNGLIMLIQQALKSFSIWTSLQVLEDEKLINQIKDVLHYELYR